MHLSKATRNPKIIPQHRHLRPASACLHIPVPLQSQADTALPTPLGGAFRALPSVMQGRQQAPPAPPDTGCFPPTSQAESLLRLVGHNFPAMGYNLLPSENTSMCTADSHPPSVTQPAIPVPYLAWLVKPSCLANSRKSMVTHTPPPTVNTRPPTPGPHFSIQPCTAHLSPGESGRGEANRGRRKTSPLTRCSQLPVRVPVGDPARERLSADGTALFIQSDSPPGNKAGLYSAGTASSARPSPPPAVPLLQPARCTPAPATLTSAVPSVTPIALRCLPVARGLLGAQAVPLSPALCWLCKQRAQYPATDSTLPPKRDEWTGVNQEHKELQFRVAGT